MKSLTSLVRCVLDDVQGGCGTSTTRDFEEITRRVEHEGVSFLTITLPAFCSDFERCLEKGRVDSKDFAHFRKYRKAGKTLSIPAFLRGLTSQVFDPATGVLLDKPNICAIADIRQVCLMFKKVELECTEKRTEAAFAKYVQTEQELSVAIAELSPELREEFRRAARVIWGASADHNRPNVFWEIEEKLASHAHMPKHGPGFTADRISGNRKYDVVRWNTRMESSFPFDLFGVCRPDLAGESLDSVQFLEPGAELPVRVVTVPKTLKSPRIIAMEPCHVQYVQQSIMEMLVPAIEMHSLSSGSVNFRSQEYNREMARKASLGGPGIATLDLSEASDRVHCSLVSDLLDGLPNLRDAVLSSRTSTADVPGYGIIPLSKFASMGSALCFPIESMVFYTIIQMALHKAQGTRLTCSSVKKLKKHVLVYGDDLLVPVDTVQTVIGYLQSFGLKVNENKSFWTGKFRESCGMDAYDGACVTPTYVRSPAPDDSRHATEIVKWVALSNQLFMRGYWKASHFCRKLVEGVLKRPLPLVTEESPALGLHHFRRWMQADGWNKQLQKLVISAPVFLSKPRPSEIDGWGALLKFFLRRSDKPFEDRHHLKRAGRPLHAHIKVRRVLHS